MFFFFSTCLYFILWLPDDNPTAFSAFVKCLPILCLCGLAWSQVPKEDTSAACSYSLKICCGLVFSTLGDILLVWRNSHFEHGIVAFAFAHLFYILAFGFNPLDLKLGILLLSFSTSVYYFIFLPNLEGFLVLAVAVYVLVITVMLWRSLDQLLSAGECILSWRNVAASIGALLFAVSDLVLGIDKFSFAFPCARAVIMATYYGGQLAIALSTVKSELERDAKGKQSWSQKQLNMFELPFLARESYCCTVSKGSEVVL